MKKTLLIMFVICFGFNLYSQEKTFGIPQRSIKPVISVPKFLDSAKLSEDLRNLEILKDIYRELENDHVGAIYQYSFFVDITGKVILLTSEKKDYLIPINQYIEKTFLKYRWIPAYKLGCRKCLVKTLGIFSIDFDTENDQIVLDIVINNEKEYKIFFEKMMR